jgi:hypothetical protein
MSTDCVEDWNRDSTGTAAMISSECCYPPPTFCSQTTANRLYLSPYDLFCAVIPSVAGACSGLPGRRRGLTDDPKEATPEYTPAYI